MTSKPHRLSSCHRHPSKPVTGFCAACLRERLAGIDSSTGHEDTAEESHYSAELRRTKSCSGSRDTAVINGSTATVSEPRRRSCEVRARNTLSDLFNLDDEKKGLNRKFGVELGNLGFDIREEEEEEEEEDKHRNDGEAIRVCHGDLTDGREEGDEEAKTMKELIDLELQTKKNAGIDLKDIAGSFWEAASTFSKKLRKWTRKQNLKKHCHGHDHVQDSNGGGELMGLEIVKPTVRRLRETQSEVGEYGTGRRSCDTDPRLSIDAGRISMEESRFSFDGHRASWDGYLIGKAHPRLSPMVSLAEDVNVPNIDNSFLVEEKLSLESPGGSAQTKDYYSDVLSWQRRRRSFDRSNSHRKPAIADDDELKVISNAKVSPATTELFYGAKLLITEKELMENSLKSRNNVESNCFLGSASKNASDVVTEVENQEGLVKFQKWRRMWNNLSLAQKRKEGKLEEGYAAGDVVNKPLAESWQKLRRVVSGQVSESVSQKLIRSYSVSCKSPCRTACLLNTFRDAETKSNVLNGRQEFMLQRNRSARYSPNNLDPGLLRFYLTPLKSYRRSKSGKSSIKDLHPTTRSVL